MFRAEFPNPQFERKNWENLNGTWEFEDDRGVSGIEREVFKKEHLEKKIEVPFCPESVLSGIGDVDFHTCVWYRRDFVSKAKEGERVVLHFGAVDYDATIYVNGKEAFFHHGGYVGFECDITDYLAEGVNSLCVRAYDDDRNPLQGHGKQCRRYNSGGCDYTRTTGIWQTVWVEYVPAERILNYKVYPNIKTGEVSLHVNVKGNKTLKAIASFNGEQMGEASLNCSNGYNVLTLKLAKTILWEVGQGNLYDLVLSYGDDVVYSYFGMREVSIEGEATCINGKPVFQRLVLDQGFYRDGIYTAKTKEALEADVLMSLAVGFNGARLHQKVFEPLFLYYADKHGYLVWGEYGNWGFDTSTTAMIPNFLNEWKNEVERDFNHPALIGWCPFNETWDQHDCHQDNQVLAVAYQMTKAMDTTRPCIDTSGNYHVITDIYDIHDYSQTPEHFEERYGHNAEIPDMVEAHKKSNWSVGRYPMNYAGNQPFFISEYGGIGWDVNSGIKDAWGYGNRPTTEQEYKERYKGLTDVLLDNPHITAFCYTQLYDIEQEVNGLYTYDRVPKFQDMEYFKKVNSRKAAIEK